MTTIDLTGVAAVITDWDGTVADNNAARYRALTAALQPHGVTLTTDWYRAHAGLPVRELLQALPDAPTPLPIEDIIGASRRVLLEGPPPEPIPATLALLRRAHTLRIPCAVASNAASKAFDSR